MALFWDSSNWQPLCHECHSSKTAREDGGFGLA
jgi:5-methylcytosine-specific restriction protein A